MEEETDQPAARRSRWRRWRVPLAILLVLFLVGFAIVWLNRFSLATDYIDDEFAHRGVQASYEVRRIGFGRQVLENLVIGDPRRPDATVRRVEVGIRFGLTGPEVGLITARGVRMRGLIRDGKLSLGQVDRLLPPPSGLPFRLPDQAIDVSDAAIALDTPSGLVALGLSGRGNLADGFRGHLAMVSHGLRFGECALAEPRAGVDVRVTDLRPHFRGPAAMQSLRCGEVLAVQRPLFALDALFAPALDSWRGTAAIRTGAFRAGASRAAAAQGRVSFDGDMNRTRGGLMLAAAAARVEALEARRLRLAGNYQVSLDRGELAFDGDGAASTLTMRESSLAGIASSLRAAGGTPFGPIGEALAEALVRAGRGGMEGQAGLRLRAGNSRGAIEIGDLSLASRSGARLAAPGGAAIAYEWPDGIVSFDREFALSGGGFPDVRFQLARDRSGAMRGRGRIAPMAAGGARLALGEIEFAPAGGGRTTFRTTIMADGPAGVGRVEGLALPLAGRFGPDGLAIGETCVAASFRSLRIEGLQLGPTRLPLCPVGPAMVWQARGGALRAGAELREPRLAGRLGQSPIQVASSRLRFDLDGFSTSGLAVRLGPAGAVHRLDVAEARARFVPGGVVGTYSGLAGKLANIDLLVGEGAGRWQVRGGNVLMEGGLRLTDERDPVRFHPLVSDDFRLTLIDNRIHATGWFKHPQSGTRVNQATIDHDLRTGAGAAVLDIPGLTFTESFQPEAITPTTIGVVALVDGTITGQGRIEWDAAGSRSSGTFSTAGMKLAAPFGPVEGLTTTVHFTDLLGLVSAPGQVAEMALVQAGIDVRDGRVTYQLQPNYHVAVEGGRWPFAGGELFLQPTVLDFSQPSTKFITFRVTGMDAATFVQQMEFSNIAATGTFDGLIPMQFDIRGGQIVDGRLSAREPGGTLSYVGELTERDLGAYGSLAFNALKSLRYSRFDVTLNGALDGEFITIIDLDGIARDPELTTVPSGGGIPAMIAGRVFSQLARIPFEFNIRIEGQFRSLIGTARSFSDPTGLIQQVLPDVLRDRSATITDVQDEESEPVQ